MSIEEPKIFCVLDERISCRTHVRLITCENTCTWCTCSYLLHLHVEWE